MIDRKPNLIERIGLVLADGFLREATGANIDDDDDLYRRITSSRRDLTPLEHQRAQKIALHLYQRNGMAKRLTEMIVDYVVGEQLGIEANDEAVQAIIDEFWTDPIMDLSNRYRELIRDQSIYGELALRLFVNDKSGRCRLGVIDVERIKDVLPDPMNALIDRKLILHKPGGEAGEEVVDLIWFDDQTDSTRPTWMGDAFYFGINRVLGQHRGLPDLLASADFIDGYDQGLFNQLERTSLTNAFVWDVTLNGATEQQIQDWERRNASPPRPGSVRVHNEKEQWSAVSPELGSYQAEVVGRQIKNMILGSSGIPEAWFAEGGETNRSTLAEQGDPTYRMLKRRQQAVRSMIQRILRVVVEKAIIAGRLPASLDEEQRTANVVLPDPSEEDTKALANVLPQLANALMAAVDEKWVSRESAQIIFLSVAGQLGVEMDPNREQERIQQEQAEVITPGDEGRMAARQAVDAVLGRGD